MRFCSWRARRRVSSPEAILWSTALYAQVSSISEKGERGDVGQTNTHHSSVVVILSRLLYPAFKCHVPSRNSSQRLRRANTRVVFASQVRLHRYPRLRMSNGRSAFALEFDRYRKTTSLRQSFQTGFTVADFAQRGSELLFHIDAWHDGYFLSIRSSAIERRI